VDVTSTLSWKKRHHVTEKLIKYQVPFSDLYSKISLLHTEVVTRNNFSLACGEIVLGL
jgi:hypothetical protein